MHDTAGHEDVRVHDPGAVDEDGAVLDGDCEIGATKRLDGGVGQTAAVGDGAVDDVVLEDGGGLRRGDVAQSGGDVLEGVVGRREDGDVGRPVERGREVRGVDGPEQGGQVGVLCHGGEVAGDLEDGVCDRLARSV